MDIAGLQLRLQGQTDNSNKGQKKYVWGKTIV